MKITSIVLSFGLFFSVKAQPGLQVLNQNNISAMITDAGFFFNNSGVSSYEVPNGSGTHTIYSSAFWFAGTDVNGQQKITAQDIYGSNFDLWPGPLTLNSAVALTPNPLGETIWSVTKTEINNHILNYTQSGYIAPSSITTWPAHGDVSLGLSYYLAPFVDVNNDGYYDPLVGDYPCIKGDRAVYTIMNDKANVHGSGGNPIGIEVHFMFYQFNSTDYLNNTTFVDVDVFNRSSQTIFDFKMSFVYDADIGNPNDDYYGCDSTLNVMYMYNGDTFDEDSGGILGYGTNPPSAGMVCLSHDIESSLSFSNGAPYPYNSPSNGIEAWNVMNGTWLDGSSVYNDLGQSTTFQYSGNPNNTGEWSETVINNPPGDRRGVMTIGDGILAYEGSKKFTFAVLYDRSGATPVENVAGLLVIADSLTSFFDATLDGFCDLLVGEEEIKLNSFQMYPNPSNGAFYLKREEYNQFNVIICDISGRVVYESYGHYGKELLVQAYLPSGVYFVNVISESGELAQKLLIE